MEKENNLMEKENIHNNDNYEPIEPNYYNYKVLENLYKTMDEYLETHNNTIIEKVNYCGYQIVNNGKYPFLQFLLYKNNNLLNKHSDQLTFISNNTNKYYNNNYIDTSLLISYSENYLYKFLFFFNKDITETSILYKGFTIIDTEMYMFFDLTECKLLIDDIYSSNNLWFALPTEILNEKMLSGLKIAEDVTDFFKFNSRINYLYDKNNERYELPVVSYVCKPENKTNFTYIFGVSPEDNQSIFGPYYYFTNYENAIKEAREPNSKFGIIRIALFLERTKLVQNLITDDIDDSEIKSERLTVSNLDTNYERLTMRISDHSGRWSQHYDSIMISNVRLDDGSLLKNTPIICVKTYEQQYPLSYHFVSIRKENTETVNII
jgi:hypothetical protein